MEYIYLWYSRIDENGYTYSGCEGKSIVVRKEGWGYFSVSIFATFLNSVVTI